ncbi:MAG: hypothetical protein M1484_00330 [Patescibacteria group bacterium]|nr:hypothetical protein [Patescibacteria group bacterium]MCL5431527.1 hypothetical protein [Patescibacteria group bacterium]
MRNSFFKLLLLFVILFVPTIGGSNASFLDFVTLSGITITTGCWVAPTVPVPVYPADPTYAGAASAWNLNPYFDWTDSTSSCPQHPDIAYEFQTSVDSAGNTVLYTSNWITVSQTPPFSLPDGVYYWRVRARDSFHNTSAWSAPALLVVDRAAPTSTFTSPVPNTDVTASPIHFAGNTHDDFGVVSVDLLYSQYAGSCNSSYTLITTLVNSSVSNDFSWSYDWTPGSSGSYCLKAEGQDQAGNKEASPVVANISYHQAADPAAALSLSGDQHTITFTVNNLANFKHLAYQLTYDTSSAPQGVTGDFDLNGDVNVSRDILLGTCSTGGTCVYSLGSKNFVLTVMLTDSGGATTSLSAHL